MANQKKTTVREPAAGDSGSRIEVDVLVVGGGPAGIMAAQCGGGRGPDASC